MNRILVAASVAVALLGTAATANAGDWHKRKHHARTAHGHTVTGPQVGPPWAGPNQCFTDEGYGRYASCDGGRR